jgi:ArsR family transcriptional regulator
MVTQISNKEALAAVFKALSDPTRLEIFECLVCCNDVEIDEAGDCRPAGSLSVGEVCCRFDQTLSTISRHLKELRLAGLARTEKRGRWLYCSVNPEALALIREFVDRSRAGSTCGADEAVCCREPPEWGVRR